MRRKERRMKIKIPIGMKTKIKIERDKVFAQMSDDYDISQEEWNDLNKRYQAYNEMLKPTFRISPDTLLVVAGNLAGILLILNFEKCDI